MNCFKKKKIEPTTDFREIRVNMFSWDKIEKLKQTELGKQRI
jgi:hypothetical protein